jgi:alpha-L-fucosidase
MSSLDSEPVPDAKYLQDWLYRTCELVDKYQPQLVWFDWWVNHAAFRSVFPKFAAYYYNRGAQWDQGAAINYKLGVYPHDAAVFDIERGMQTGIYPYFWQNDTAISKNSWGYVQNQDYKAAGDLIGDLVDLVSKNGALLLNIGPRPDGTIPEPEQKILLEMGAWLRINGEAIYATRPWKIYGEGPTQVVEGQFTDTKRTVFTGEDIRFTRRGADLYATILAWPGRQAVVKSLGTATGLWEGDVGSISLLGCSGKLEFSRGEGGLTVNLPDQQPCEHAFVLKISH